MTNFVVWFLVACVVYGVGTIVFGVIKRHIAKKKLAKQEKERRSSIDEETQEEIKSED